MKCDWLLGEGYTCNNEHDDPSGLCSTHRAMPGAGSSVSGLRRERDRLYDQAASDTIAAGRLRDRIAVLERDLAAAREYVGHLRGVLESTAGVECYGTLRTKLRCFPNDRCSSCRARMALTGSFRE